VGATSAQRVLAGGSTLATDQQDFSVAGSIGDGIKIG